MGGRGVLAPLQGAWWCAIDQSGGWVPPATFLRPSGTCRDGASWERRAGAPGLQAGRAGRIVKHWTSIIYASGLRGGGGWKGWGIL